MSSAKRKPEDTAGGCRALEQVDRLRASATPNAHMREILQRSADAWNARAELLDGLEAGFNERAAENLELQPGRRMRGKQNG